MKYDMEKYLAIFEDEIAISRSDFDRKYIIVGCYTASTKNKEKKK